MAAQEFADPGFVFDIEMSELDGMLADVQLPPEAYDVDGKVIVHAQPSSEETDEELRQRVVRERWYGASDGQVLRRTAGAMSWGALDLADTNGGAVLPRANTTEPKP